MNQSENKVPVMIPESLYEGIRNVTTGKGFASVDDYVVYVLNIVNQRKGLEVSEKEDERVTERLKALGYI